MNLYSIWPFAQISDGFYYLDIWQCARYFVTALFKELALITISEMWGLGLELPGLGLCLDFYDKVSVSVSSRNLSQVSVSEVTVSTTSLLLRFKSCDISIYWWIWMFADLDRNWYFYLNFFATFGSVLGLQITVNFGSVLELQVTVGLQFNTGLQPPTRWEPLVAGTMLCRPQQTKERVEPTILSKIANDIRHLTRFALLFLIQILRYMWRIHVATCA